MKIVWKFYSSDITKVKGFVKLHRNNPFVQRRIQRNLQDKKAAISLDEFWFVMVCCLLTTQQRSGPYTSVSRFILKKPFSLRYKLCKSQDRLYDFAYETLTNFGGIRRTNRLSEEITTNFSALEKSLWDRTHYELKELRASLDAQRERKSAEFIEEHFMGFGPKQSRNLLQTLGLTRFEIPIDSRITKWLNEFGFPVTLSARALSDRNYYNFVSDGIQQLCKQSDVYPCVFDAAIFSSYDGDKWAEKNLVL